MFNSNTPVILVARGCLAPYFLGWWKAQANPLHVLNFSRWRWFENGNRPTWIGEPAPVGQVVLFDRNTTTGQTLRLLRCWLREDGYEPVVLGHMDRDMGRFGAQFLDLVWDDREGYDRLGLACGNAGGVKIVSRDEYLAQNQLGGHYTIAVLGGSLSVLGGIACPEAAHVRLSPQPAPGSVIYQNVPDWEVAMILGYVEQKPLITIAGAPGIVTDYGWGEPLDEIFDLMNQEGG